MEAAQNTVVCIELAVCRYDAPVDIVALELPDGATVADALAAPAARRAMAAVGTADLGQARPTAQALAVGVWGRACSGSRVLATGDRVEVYCQLILSPKEARRLRAKAQIKQSRIRRLP